MPLSPNCIFCRIITKALPASRVYEDNKCLAFLDLHPINEGHVLIIPKRHAERLAELPETDAGHLLQIGHRILKAIQDSTIPCEGANLFLSDGPVAGQEVMHSHLHIAPRFAGDGLRTGFVDSDPEEYTPERLNQIANQIKVQLPQEVEIIEQPRLETDRLILEAYKETDLFDVFAYASDPEVTKYLPWEAHKSIEDAKEFFFNFVQRQTCLVRGRLFFTFAIRLKESGKVVGSIDFKNINLVCGQIDYALGFNHWKKGIMSEAAGAIRDWAFSSFSELTRLQAYCVVENRGSSRVMEKIGMTKEGIKRKAFSLKGQVVDLSEYALIRESP